ncbi:MAG: cobalamin biosynthesis protein [Rhodobacteraceae bacterium]|nr:cobalamin biosynthesis protein [Paracoccaceae bacterium]
MLLFSDMLPIVLGAIILDALAGDPRWLWSRLPHPVVIMGAAISLLDRRLNKPAFSSEQRRLYGSIALLLLLAISSLIGLLVHWFASQIPFGWLLEVLAGFTLIAQRSLYDHVKAVKDGLMDEGLEGGRKAVSMIVGRDPAQLNESGIARAAIESCAENFSDGVVAPIFWFLILGLPGLIAYKAVNTADSMIGHKNQRYSDFGWASARFDDLVNLPASRLAGLLIAISAPVAKGSPLFAVKTIFKDAAKHRSPNAGWPESAMAGALDIALAGPRIYPGYSVDDAFLNAFGRQTIGVSAISDSLKILQASCTLLAILVVIVALSP